MMKKYMLVAVTILLFVSSSGFACGAEDPRGAIGFLWGQSEEQVKARALEKGYILDAALPGYGLPGGGRAVCYNALEFGGEVTVSLLFFRDSLFQVAVTSVEPDEVMFNETRSEFTLVFETPEFNEKNNAWEWTVGDTFIQISMTEEEQAQVIFTSEKLITEYIK